MTVAELIKKLQSLPQEMKVYNFEDGADYEITDVLVQNVTYYNENGNKTKSIGVGFITYN